MKKYYLAALIGISSLFTLGTAEARVYRCDSCYTDNDFKVLAKTLGNGQDHIIYNLPANLIQTWWVPDDGIIVDPLSGAGTFALPSQPPTKITTPPSAVIELDKAHTVYVIGGGTLRPIINVPISELHLPHALNKSAYDVVTDANLRAMVESAAGDIAVMSAVTGANLLTAIADLTGLATSYLGLRDQSGLLFKVVMSDGSYFHIKVEINHPNGDYLEGTARTASGQLIPESIYDVQGEWSGSSDNLAAFVDHVIELGAKVTYVGTGGVITGTVCSGSGADKVCVVYTVAR